MSDWCDYGDLPTGQCDHCITGSKGATTIRGWGGSSRFGNESTHPDANLDGEESNAFTLRYASYCRGCKKDLAEGARAKYVGGQLVHADAGECAFS